MKLNSLIIGAGNIASEYDEPTDYNILSHANAYFKHPNFNLIGFVDVDIDKAKIAAKKWKCGYFNSVDEVLIKHRVDVYSVCVPNDFHYEVLKTLCKLKNIFIFTEKPLTSHLYESEEIVELMLKNNISCSVNYKREFLPEFSNFYENSKKNIYGKLNFGACYYSKGLNHNGSHAISILNNLYPIENLRVLNSFERIKEIDSDPSSSFLMEINNDYHFLFKSFQNENYPIFELDFHFENARIRIIELGVYIEFSSLKNNSTFKTHKFIEKDEMIPTNLNISLKFSLDNIFNHLTKNEKLISPVSQALKVMQTVDLIKTELKK